MVTSLRKSGSSRLYSTKSMHELKEKQPASGAKLSTPPERNRQGHFLAVPLPSILMFPRHQILLHSKVCWLTRGAHWPTSRRRLHHLGPPAPASLEPQKLNRDFHGRDPVTQSPACSGRRCRTAATRRPWATSLREAGRGRVTGPWMAVAPVAGLSRQGWRG